MNGSREFSEAWDHYLVLSVAARSGAIPELFTIPKASSPEHVAENARAGVIRLTEAEIEEIDRAFPLGRRPSVLPTL
jgi:diketogulonate reductase-like aldo/keto reductase